MEQIFNFISEHNYAIAASGRALLSAVLTIHILLYKEDVKASIGWIALVVFSPVVGGIFYIILGINRVRRKAARLKKPSPPPEIKNLKEKFSKIKEGLGARAMQLLRLGFKIHPQLMEGGNEIIPLINGDAAYPQMCSAIKNAKHEVLIASYIFKADKAGLMFVDALKEAAGKGVKVYVLIDDVGSPRGFKDMRKSLRGVANVKLGVFLPTLVALPFLNLRNHRKILVVDGGRAFFGGMNIHEENLIKNNPPFPMRDITFSIRGPAVKQIAKLFEDDWNFTVKENLKVYESPEPFTGGNSYCRLVPDGPDENYGKIELLTLGAIKTAADSLSIITPYFLPEETILKSLEIAAMRGVKIDLILPEKSDIWGMDYATASLFKRLLYHGINIYLTPPPFDHSKLFIADGLWCAFGSANWDERSFKLNFEANIECVSKSFADELSGYFNRKRAKAKKLSPEDVHAYGLLKRLRNNAFRLLTPYY